MTLEALGPLSPLAADLVLVLGFFLVLVADLILPPGEKRVLGWGTLASLIAALAATFLFDLQGEALGGAYIGDEMAVLFKRIFLTGGALTVLGSLDHVAERSPRRQGEYHLMLLSSVLGMLLLAGTRDMILLVVSFELMGIPLYVLAAWGRTDRLGVEGALKLFLVGAVSSAVILYGLSLLFGVAGTTQLQLVAEHVAAHPSPLALVGGTMALAGMGFKLGAFPFHMWVPDTYQGADTPFVAFLSVAPKAAGLAALVQVLLAGEATLLESVLRPVLGIVVATLLAGNLLAINQSNIKRLLGYSGVAHIGFLLLALATGSPGGLAMLLFYLMAYLFTNIGAFLVVHAVARAGGNDTVDSFDGLGRRSGWLSLAMLVFLLSLAGIPFVAGFWAKLYVFLAAWMTGLQWLVVLGALLSVVGLFYYLRVARAMFMKPPTDASRITVEPATNLAITVCLLFVVGMGLVPGPFVEAAHRAAEAFVLSTAIALP